MMAETSRDKRYSLAIPYLALLYKILGDFCTAHGNVGGLTGSIL